MCESNATRSEAANVSGRPRDENDIRYELNDFGETVSFFSSIKQLADGAKGSAAIEIPPAIGRYKILDVLGHGGFGVVYRGYDPKLGRDVAIKTPLFESTPKTVEEFLQEARRLAKLTHPGIVSVLDVGMDDGLCYIVSEFLDGKDLRYWLREHRPSWQESVRLIAAVADALAAAHSRNTIHRDIKPANIIVAEHAGGIAPVIVDFGVALSESSSPQRGLVAGTLTYMSPEQSRGEGHRIDGRTDIYSLGVVLYYLICGQFPFQAATGAELRRMIQNDEPQPPRQRVAGIPRELERICLKAMAKQIADRYTTAADMAAELRSLLKQHEAEAEALQAASRGKEETRPHGTMKILIADDHDLSRFKLQHDLERWGHSVAVAEDGEQAWRLFQQDEFSIVITDWMMPQVDGLELVQRIRGTEQAEYVYIIMLTAKAEMHDVVAGMSAGADDFLTKPFHRDELQVRLRAGARVTRLNRELNETNRRMRRSLAAAGQIQRSFLPASKPEIAGFDFAWDHRPCVELGGDMLNIVPLDDGYLGLYILDVNGEGVPAALFATSLSRLMSPANDPASLLVDRTVEGRPPRIRAPAEVAQSLNGQLADDPAGKQFFTLIYGVLNLESREFRYTNAGHPPVLHQHADASPQLLDATGYPIGLASETDVFAEQTVLLQPGDRLLMYSDGVPDAMNPDGDIFGTVRLLESAARYARLPLDELVRSLMRDLVKWRGKADFDDDVSLLTCAAAH